MNKKPDKGVYGDWQIEPKEEEKTLDEILGLKLTGQDLRDYARIRVEESQRKCREEWERKFK